MRRGHGWWGTGPLVVGATGLLLMAFGAAGLPDAGEINATAHAAAAKLEKDLNEAQSPDQMIAILQDAEEKLDEEGKSVDIRAVAPRRGLEGDAEWIPKVCDAFEKAWSDHRDPKGVLAGRIAFYGGLVLAFAAGFLLYRRTPDSVYKAW